MIAQEGILEFESGGTIKSTPCVLSKLTFLNAKKKKKIKNI